MDRATQRWVISTGRPVTIVEGGWLDGPVGAPEGVGEDWIDEHAERTGAGLLEEGPRGLLPGVAALVGPALAGTVAPAVADFYTDTAAWHIDVWSRWSRWAEPGGRLLNAVFARRLRQLALPLDPLEVAGGMRSRVVVMTAPDGRRLGTVWQRTLRATGQTVFGGFYGPVTRPGAERASVRVVFPLPNGSLTVLLAPTVTADGGLVLSAGGGAFGDDGHYLLVRPDGAEVAWVRRVPLRERFELHAEPDGTVRCDHRLALGPAEVLRLHYRLRRRETRT